MRKPTTKPSITLQVVDVAKPCTADWNAMQGSATRFCTHCQKSVHNLSQMSQSDAENLVCQTAGSLCIRFERDAKGELMTLDYKTRTKNRRGLWPALSALTSALSLFACYLYAGDKPTSRPTAAMGEMCPPPIVSPTTAPTTLPTIGIAPTPIPEK